MECFLICDNCQKKTIYIKGFQNKCTFCKKEIQIEKGVEELVIVLNNVDVITSSSCAGHYDGFDIGKRSYPCVVLSSDKKSYIKAMEIIGKYNKTRKKKDELCWTIRHERTLLGWKRFVLPEERDRSLGELHEEALLLAEYVKRLF